MALGFFTHLAGDYAVAWKLSHEMNLPPPSDGQRNRNKARIRKHGITYRMMTSMRTSALVTLSSHSRACVCVQECEFAFRGRQSVEARPLMSTAGAWAPAMPPGA